MTLVLSIFERVFKFAWGVVRALSTGVTLVLVAFLFSGVFLYLQIPSTKELKSCLKTSMFGVDLCPSKKNYVHLSQVSPNLLDSVIFSEDGKFYSHNGFDLVELANSLQDNLESGEFKRGGSTITQQLAKNLFLGGEKSLWRKIKEAAITIKIERTLKKREIVERYLNVVEFGPKIFGVKQASSYYFQKSPSELTVVESAFLAMILPNPKKYSSSYRKKALTKYAKRRMAQIIEGLYRQHRISESEFVGAMSEMNSLFTPEETLDVDLVPVDLVPGTFYHSGAI